MKTMISVPISDVRTTLVKAAMVRGLVQDEAEVVVEYYLDAELRGIATHGVSRFLVITEAIRQRKGKPWIVRQSTAFALVDGQQELGVLAARYCIDLVAQKTRQNGIGLVALKNSSRYNRLAPFSRQLAEANLVGMVINTAGPPAVAPYGSYTPILGTNPISIAFPGSPARGGPLVIDMSTSQATWGEIRQAIIEQRPLPPDTFYTATGAYAVEPGDAAAVQAYGGAKGYALCLAIEVLCGAFIGAQMGTNVTSEYELGFLFMGLDPLMFRDSINDFTMELDTLKQAIHQAEPLREDQAVRLPGERADAVAAATRAAGSISLDAHTWSMLCAMAHDPDAGLAATHLTN